MSSAETGPAKFKSFRPLFTYPKVEAPENVQIAKFSSIFLKIKMLKNIFKKGIFQQTVFCLRKLKTMVLRSEILFLEIRQIGELYVDVQNVNMLIDKILFKKSKENNG
jgi:hypothetical protein